MRDTETTPAPRSIWARGVYMLVFVFIYGIAETVVVGLALIQFVLALVTGGPNPQLAALGRKGGVFIGDIVQFLTFASDRLPFPFDDWPGDPELVDRGDGRGDGRSDGRNDGGDTRDTGRDVPRPVD